MNILITGAAGFLGTHLQKLISGDTVTKLVRKSNGQTNEHVIDLTDERQVYLALDAGKFSGIDVIINLASIVAKSSTVDDLSLLCMNAQIAKSVAIIARDSGAKKLVNISSMAVYPFKDGDFTEDSMPDPSVNNDCVYGLSKLNGEILINYLLRDKSILISHLRMAMIYGAGMNETRIIPVMEKELKEKDTITVFGGGQRLLNLIEVNKAAEVITKFVYEDHPGIYNVGNEILSMEELALRISNGRPEVITRIEAGNRSKFRLNTAKLMAILEE